jgi:hypothetical protein
MRMEPVPPLQRADGVAAKPGTIGEILLRQAGSLSQSSQTIPER